MAQTLLLHQLRLLLLFPLLLPGLLRGAIASMLPISPQSGPLAFPYLQGAATQGYSMNLPPAFLDMVTADARRLRHKAEGGNYIDNKGTTWWQPKSEPRRFSIEQMIEIIGKVICAVIDSPCQLASPSPSTAC